MCFFFKKNIININKYMYNVYINICIYNIYINLIYSYNMYIYYLSLSLSLSLSPFSHLQPGILLFQQLIRLLPTLAGQPTAPNFCGCLVTLGDAW